MNFTDFWAAYPRRKGSNPRAMAEKKFALAVKNGADPAHLVSSAKRYADELKEQGKFGTEYVCMAQTWLNQKRWIDYAPETPVEKPIRVFDERYVPVRETLVKMLGEDVVRSWFDDLEVISSAGTIGQLKAPTQFIKKWIETRYFDQFSEAWLSVHKHNQMVQLLPFPR